MDGNVLSLTTSLLYAKVLYACKQAEILAAFRYSLPTSTLKS